LTPFNSYKQTSKTIKNESAPGSSNIPEGLINPQNITLSVLEKVDRKRQFNLPSGLSKQYNGSPPIIE
jgi:hypothetical protein